MKCPRCEKRILDIRTNSDKEIKIETRCPNCNRMVTVIWKPENCRQKYVRNGNNF